MYSSIIEINRNVPGETLMSLHKVAENAFSNRAGSVRNSSSDPYRLVFKGNEDMFGCLEVGMLELEDKHDFLRQVHSWRWIDDEDPSENCDIRNLKANKKYYVRVQAYKTVNGKTYYSGWSEIKNIKTLSEEVSISKLSARKKGFAIKWKNYNAEAAGYEIAYSTSRKFAEKQTKTITVKKRKTTSKTVSKLKAKKKYYVKIRTYRTERINGKSRKVYSDWSKAKAITTKK